MNLAFLAKVLLWIAVFLHSIPGYEYIKEFIPKGERLTSHPL